MTDSRLRGVVFFLAHAVIGVGVILGAAAACASPAELDWDHPFEPGTSLPRFLTHDFIDISNVVAISKFRSGAGHVFADEYEAPDRSMKNYIQPLASLSGSLGTNIDLAVFAPTSGTVVSIAPEGRLPSGEIRGYQVHIVPDGHAMFEVRLFHVNTLESLAVGTHVVAGDQLGFADMREAHDSDIAIDGIFKEVPVYSDRPSGWGYMDRGVKLFSPFDFMTDALFDEYLLRGAHDRDDFAISKAFRDDHPADFSGFDPADWFFLTTRQPVPEPTTGALLGIGLAAMALRRRSRRS